MDGVSWARHALSWEGDLGQPAGPLSSEGVLPPPRAGEATAGTGDLHAARSGLQVAPAERVRGQRGGPAEDWNSRLQRGHRGSSGTSSVLAPEGGLPGPADPHTACPVAPPTAGQGLGVPGAGSAVTAPRRSPETLAELSTGRTLWASGHCWTGRCLWPLGREEPCQVQLCGSSPASLGVCCINALWTALGLPSRPRHVLPASTLEASVRTAELRQTAESQVPHIRGQREPWGPCSCFPGRCLPPVRPSPRAMVLTPWHESPQQSGIPAALDAGGERAGGRWG